MERVTRGDLAVDELFGGTSCEEDTHPLLKILYRVDITLLWELHRKA